MIITLAQLIDMPEGNADRARASRMQNTSPRCSASSA
jgi:hypothetical protein